MAVFHNSLAAERHSSVKDEIQPRSCESYYRTRTVVNCNSYLWITVWCPSILSFCHCLALVLLTLSFNSSPSQFSEIVFLKVHQINTTMKTNLPSTALLTWFCSRPIGLRLTWCSFPETPYFPPSQFKINSHSSSPAPQFTKKYSSHPPQPNPALIFSAQVNWSPRHLITTPTSTSTPCNCKWSIAPINVDSTFPPRHWQSHRY